MRLAIQLLMVVALPGLVFGSLLQAAGTREQNCGSSDVGGLLSLISTGPCLSGDYSVLLPIGLIVVVAVIAVGLMRARPR